VRQFQTPFLRYSRSKFPTYFVRCRFGVGLTLCILHSFIGTRGETVIRSTCRGSGIERVCVLTADLDKDKIVEVGGGGKKGKTKGREVPSDIGLGGTTVSMLLPSGGHEEAFPRIAEYLSRFHLLPEKSKLSLSFEAPTLSPLKLLINPKANFIDGVRSYLNKEDLEESHVSTKSILSGLNGSEVKIQITLVLEGAGRGDEGDYEGDELEGLGGCDLLEDDMDSDEGSLGSGDGQVRARMIRSERNSVCQHLSAIVVSHRCYALRPLDFQQTHRSLSSTYLQQLCNVGFYREQGLWDCRGNSKVQGMEKIRSKSRRR